MGQRLVITIQSCNEAIARIYYNWSAYTCSALEEAREIVKCICDTEAATVPQLQLALIRMCENNGGGIAGGLKSSVGEMIQEMFPNEVFSKKSPDRNNGLIAITKYGMDELMAWAEGELTIDVDEDTIYNSVFYASDFDEWKENYGDIHGKTEEEIDRITLDDLPKLRNRIDEVDFDHLDALIHELEVFARNGIYTFTRGSTVYEMIA